MEIFRPLLPSGARLSHMLIIAAFHSFLVEFISTHFELAILLDLCSYEVVVKI